MELKGKCEEEFVVYLYEKRKEVVAVYHNDRRIITFWTWWNELHPSMKSGVLIDFFDEHGIMIDVEPTCKVSYIGLLVCPTLVYGKDYNNSFKEYPTRHEAS